MTKKPSGPPAAAEGAPTQIPKGISNPQLAASGTGSGGASSSEAGKLAGAAGNPDQQITGIGFDSDEKGVDLQGYGIIVKERIKQKWFIPDNLKNYQGSVTILFTILKNGNVFGARVFSQSGNETLDLTALTAVINAKLPPLPNTFASDRLSARLVFAYNEQK
jgi:TonB family protein